MDNYKTMLDAARDATGLNDFGQDSFREGLEILVKALRREARLNALGERVLRDRIEGHLMQRLQVEDWYRRYPEIDEVPIITPLVGVSLPRTGSTVLSFLLAQDTRARSLRRAEATSPCPPPGSVTTPASRSEQDVTMLREAGLKPHVPAGEDAPAECQDLMALDFKSHIFQAFAQVPSYSAWLLDTDLTSTYHYERRVLKLLQWRCPELPWRLKCPTHLLYLEQLNSAFPDARFVMTHREPSEVMLSVIAVYCDIVGRFTDAMDIAYLAELNIQHWSVGMQRALTFRAAAAHNARFYDIDFRAMHHQPVEEVRGLYQWLEEPVNADFAASMVRWCEENSGNREADRPREPKSYGIDTDRVCALFADYTRHMTSWTKRETTQNGD